MIQHYTIKGYTMSQQQYDLEVMMELQQDDFIDSINATLREISSFLVKHNDIFLAQLENDGDK